MAKTFTTRAAALAHIAQTKVRVRRIIQYHNRANAAGAGRAKSTPRNPVPNVGRAAGREVDRATEDQDQTLKLDLVEHQEHLQDQLEPHN